jgi:hypothetical protein
MLKKMAKKKRGCKKSKHPKKRCGRGPSKNTKASKVKKLIKLAKSGKKKKRR